METTSWPRRRCHSAVVRVVPRASSSRSRRRASSAATSPRGRAGAPRRSAACRPRASMRAPTSGRATLRRLRCRDGVEALPRSLTERCALSMDHGVRRRSEPFGSPSLAWPRHEPHRGRQRCSVAARSTPAAARAQPQRASGSRRSARAPHAAGPTSCLVVRDRRRGGQNYAPRGGSESCYIKEGGSTTSGATCARRCGRRSSIFQLRRESGPRNVRRAHGAAARCGLIARAARAAAACRSDGARARRARGAP